jgi:hypothetical protein
LHTQRDYFFGNALAFVFWHLVFGIWVVEIASSANIKVLEREQDCIIIMHEYLPTSVSPASWLDQSEYFYIIGSPCLLRIP